MLIFNIVAPIFLVIAAGYAAARLKLFTLDAADHLMRFVVYFAVTALLFHAALKLDLSQAMQPAFLISYYAPVLICFALSGLISRYGFQNRPGVAVSAGFSAIFGNSVFLGIPIMARAFGEAGHNATFGLIALHAPVMYLLGSVTMESVASHGGGAGRALKRASASLARNPLVNSLFIGLGANLLGLRLPEALEGALTLLGQAALPCGIFAVGAALTRYRLRDALRDAVPIMMIKLFLHPLLALFFAHYLLGLPPVQLGVAVLMAAMPSGLNIYIFAALYDRGKGLAASVILLCTAFSLVTIPLWIYIIMEYYSGTS